MPDTTRLSAEQVAYYASLDTAPNVAQPLAREVQMWRALVHGGPDGPGIAERLEAIVPWIIDTEPGAAVDVQQIIADLRREEPTDGR